MAFAAARMLKDKKDQESRKRSSGLSHSASRTMNKVETVNKNQFNIVSTSTIFLPFIL